MRLCGYEVSRRRLAAGRFGVRALLLPIAVATIGLAAAESASADTPIEGVWSFNGGKVAIQEAPDGTFHGTVVSPTKFAQCTHPVGEEMWTGITAQADGSYWGLHQWFFETEECVPNPILGPTAWRVLRNGETRFLRVCFSAPGSNSQPTIGPDGAAANVTFECIDSARISSLPEVSSAKFARYVTLPGRKTCVARKRLRIRMRDPKNDPLAKIVVTLKSGAIHRKAKIVRGDGGAVATLSLRGLPNPTFTVTVRLTTVLGRHLSAKRKYRSCAQKTGKRVRPHRARHLG